MSLERERKGEGWLGRAGGVQGRTEEEGTMLG